MELSRNQSIVLGLIVIAIVLVYSGVIQSPLSLLSASPSVRFSNGNVYHIAQLTINGEQSTTYQMVPQNYTLSNGSTVVPTSSATFTFTPSQQFCTYQLTAQSDPVILGQNLNGWYYYSLSSPRLSAFIRVNSSNSNGDIVLNATQPGNQATLSASDGSGSVSAEVQGGFGTDVNCPSGSFTVLNNNGHPKVVDSAAYLDYKTRRFNDAIIVCGFGGVINPLAVSTCLNNALTDVATGSGIPAAPQFNNIFLPDTLVFADPLGTQIHTRMVGAAQPTTFANPVIVLTADQAYFNSFIYSPPAIGNPQIVSISCGDVTEARSATVRAIFRNSGTGNTIFRYNANSNKGSLTPPTGTIPLSGDQSVQDFGYSVPSVSANESYSVNVQLCSSNQLGSNCVESQCSGNIIDVPASIIPGPAPTPYCGDNQCNAARGETSSTCPADCAAQVPATQCTMANARLIGGECLCVNGYQRTFDGQTGAMMCSAPQDYTQYWPYAIVLIAVIFLGYAVIRKKR